MRLRHPPDIRVLRILQRLSKAHWSVPRTALPHRRRSVSRSWVVTSFEAAQRTEDSYAFTRERLRPWPRQEKACRNGCARRTGGIRTVYVSPHDLATDADEGHGVRLGAGVVEDALRRVPVSGHWAQSPA